MPTLQFKGKNLIWNHHLSIPYHTLEDITELSYNLKNANGNQIIEGDNLLALKSLLPMFTGRINCIYIDPPYNTGTENWIYNDNVNSPLMKDWFGKAVGKDDLTRHDKWLCMMTPRLKLLRELLADDGSIFISIDDNELTNLRLLMDEIFGENNFRNIILIRRGIKSVQAQFETIDRLNYGCEYLVVYSKKEDFKYKKFEIELENGKEGSWNNHWRGTDRPTMRYELFGTTPETGQWRWGKERSYAAVDNYKDLLKELSKTENDITQEDIDNWYKKNIEETGEEIDLLRLSNNGKPEHYIPPSESKLASTHWSDLKPNGSSQVKSLFKKKVFDNPKSVDLIKRIIRFAEGDSKNTIILDSFAGSGTTMHAMMELNKEDEGNRKCILVQMTEATLDAPEKNICRHITRERIKLAIEKYKFDFGFKYIQIGTSIDAESMLSGNLPTFKQLAKYVFYLCIGQNLETEDQINEIEYFVGSNQNTVVYLIYQQNYDVLTKLALNLPFAERITSENAGKKCIVYAPACFLDQEYLEQKRIEFVSIPYNLFQKNEG